MKALRRDRPKKERRERRGSRRRHLRAAWKASAAMGEQSKDACNLWAAATTSWQALARAYEVASGDGEPCPPGVIPRTPTRGDLSFGRKGNQANAMHASCCGRVARREPPASRQLLRLRPIFYERLVVLVVATPAVIDDAVAVRRAARAKVHERRTPLLATAARP
eukprot:1295072-Prymnesium_polylepis.1